MSKLPSNDLVALSQLATKAKKEQKEQAQKAVSVVKDILTKASDTAIGHLILVAKNNPGKTTVQLLNRPDIQQSFSYPFEQAEKELLEIVESAWSSGSELGLKQAARELELLGVAVPSVQLPETAWLKSLKEDVSNNAKKTGERLSKALLKSDREEVEKSVRKAAEDAVRRSVYSAESAFKRSVTEAKDAVFGAAGTNKMWATYFRPTTCKWCRDLNGQVVSAGQPFVIKGLKLYGPLHGPLLHPNCGCVVVPVLVTSAPEVEATAYIQAVKTDGAIPSVIKSLAIHSMSPAAFALFLAWLLRKIV